MTDLYIQTLLLIVTGELKMMIMWAKNTKSVTTSKITNYQYSISGMKAMRNVSTKAVIIWKNVRISTYVV